MENNLKLLREIEIARLELIGASLAALGDGIIAVSAGLALELLESEYNREHRQSQQTQQLEEAHRQLDYLIHELLKLRARMS
ncbi:translation initiation factor 2 [Paenibacillus sp. PL2-23]|uniref:translation initiation factor 2 n=1 Tax=Paenibacillus sp. PL2-23 TaxID=2100729 RepID=UPI0030FC63F7